MGYKMPIVCKELYLPIDASDVLTIEQYKEKYGIDIAQYIKLEDGYIYLDFPKFTKVFLVLMSYYEFTSIVKVGTPYHMNEAQWVEGSNTGSVQMGIQDSLPTYAWGIQFSISKDDEFTLDNVTIEGYAA